MMYGEHPHQVPIPLVPEWCGVRLFRVAHSSWHDQEQVSASSWCGELQNVFLHSSAFFNCLTSSDRKPILVAVSMGQYHSSCGHCKKQEVALGPKCR
jgi:hypothetical protein